MASRWGNTSHSFSMQAFTRKEGTGEGGGERGRMVEGSEFCRILRRTNHRSGVGSSERGCRVPVPRPTALCLIRLRAGMNFLPESTHPPLASPVTDLPPLGPLLVFPSNCLQIPTALLPHPFTPPLSPPAHPHLAHPPPPPPPPHRTASHRLTALPPYCPPALLQSPTSCIVSIGLCSTQFQYSFISTTIANSNICNALRQSPSIRTAKQPQPPVQPMMSVPGVGPQNMLPPIGNVTSASNMLPLMNPSPPQTADPMRQLAAPAPNAGIGNVAHAAGAPPSRPPQPPLDNMRAYRACLNCRNRKSKCDLDINGGRPVSLFHFWRSRFD